MNENNNSRKQKAYIAIVAVLFLVIVVLGIMIVSGGKKKKDNKEATEAVTVAENTEVTENTVTEATEAITEQVTETTTEKENIIKEYTFTKGSGWEDSGKYACQYDFRFVNKESSGISGWSVKVSGCKDVEITNIWNAEYKKDNDVITFTAVDYNEVIEANAELSFGFIMTAASEADADKLSANATLYIDGKPYGVDTTEGVDEATTEKQEVTTETVVVENGTPFANHGKISVKGTDIVDMNGNKYQLKGPSTHGIAWFPEYVNKDAFKTIRDDWGANLIRIAMYTDENGGYCSGGNKDNLKKLVSDGVDYATELGMYVIIDWHILHDLTPVKYQSEAEKFFDEMSSKYKDSDNIIYEICNEPNGGTSWSEVKKYAEDIIPIIRKNDPDAIIVVGTPTWSQDVDKAAADPITGYDNIMYTVHFYAATHKEDLRNKLKKARDKGLAIFITEFSICDASGNGGIDYNEAAKWMDLINELNLSYGCWSLCNKAETSALIAPACAKKSGWTDSDLSDAGKWLIEQLK